MTKIKTAAGLGALLAATAATTAVALPGGAAPAEKKAEQHREAQAKALGQKLDIAPSRVETALSQIRGERREKVQGARAAALGKRLGVSAATAERGLEKGIAARKSATGKERGKAFRAAVAKETGKSEDQVKKAMKAVAKEFLTKRLATAEKNGTISKERAAKVREKIRSGKLGPKVRKALR